MTTTSAAGRSLDGEVRALRDRQQVIDGFHRFVWHEGEPSALFGAAAGAVS